jgi:hypothetical protein
LLPLQNYTLGPSTDAACLNYFITWFIGLWHALTACDAPLNGFMATRGGFIATRGGFIATRGGFMACDTRCDSLWRPLKWLLMI